MKIKTTKLDLGHIVVLELIFSGPGRPAADRRDNAPRHARRAVFMRTPALAAPLPPATTVLVNGGSASLLSLYKPRERPHLRREASDVGRQFIQVRHVATVSGANSFKFVMLPPQLDTTRDWAKRLAEVVPEARVIVAEDAETAGREIVDAEAAFGWLGSDLLLKARKLRWLQAPQASGSSERSLQKRMRWPGSWVSQRPWLRQRQHKPNWLGFGSSAVSRRESSPTRCPMPRSPLF
jgi:hypothetical protein